MEKTPCLIEVCCSSLADVLAAARGGAQRIELCIALGCGGVTPSLAFACEAACEVRKISPNIKLHALIRYRDGDFLRSPAEASIETQEIAEMHEGVAGVVVGALQPDGSLCETAMMRYAHAAKSLGVALTCSRVFDLCADKARALEQLIEWGYDYVLTSGGAPTAMEGLDALRDLQAQADGRITLIAAGGVNGKNCEEIISKTGIRQLHGSLREAVAVGAPSLPGLEPCKKATSETLVREVAEKIKSL